MFSHCESVTPKTTIGTVEEFCTYSTCALLSPTPCSVYALTVDMVGATKRSCAASGTLPASRSARTRTRFTRLGRGREETDVRSAERRCEAPQGGAIETMALRNSDRRCEAPQGGAIETMALRNSDRRCEAP